ncbi:MAG: DUF1223 domain-containing protein [Acidobacteriota bacterium]|nr:DUF1223 domain-containing protein [Acidobacteriota bacterium]
MRKWFALALAVAVLAALAVAAVAFRGRGVRGPDAAGKIETAGGEAPFVGGGVRAPVVVELFTSEGCSSCPPADALLARLDKEQPVEGAEVIALAQHVDYWNNLGWADPFSAHEFSERQSEYAAHFGGDSVYTPQMVVDGGAEFPGSNSGKALDAIARAAREPKAEVSLERVADQADAGDALRLSVRIVRLPKLTDGDTADVLLAVTESGLSSDVARGENAGHRLMHAGVVRSLTKLGYLSAATPPFADEPLVALDKGWRRENLRVVVFLQEHTSKRVVGAAAIKLFG